MTFLGGIENVLRRFFLYIYYLFILEVMTLLRGVERVLSRDFFNLGGESGSGKKMASEFCPDDEDH